MSELEKLETDLRQLEEGMSGLDEKLRRLLEFKSVDALGENLSLLDQAKLNVSMAYALNSLYFSKASLGFLKFGLLVYMKLNAIPTENHKINQENVD